MSARTIRRGVVVLKAEPTADDRCGTYAGYRRHQERNERQCWGCFEAARDRDRARRIASLRVREEVGLPATFGRYAGTQRPHSPVYVGLGRGQCSECFGWPDDVRHLAVEVAA